MTRVTPEAMAAALYGMLPKCYCACGKAATHWVQVIGVGSRPGASEYIFEHHKYHPSNKHGESRELPQAEFVRQYEAYRVAADEKARAWVEEGKL